MNILNGIERSGRSKTYRSGNNSKINFLDLGADRLPSTLRRLAKRYPSVRGAGLVKLKRVFAHGGELTLTGNNNRQEFGTLITIDDSNPGLIGRFRISTLGSVDAFYIGSQVSPEAQHQQGYGAKLDVVTRKGITTAHLAFYEIHVDEPLPWNSVMREQFTRHPLYNSVSPEHGFVRTD